MSTKEEREHTIKSEQRRAAFFYINKQTLKLSLPFSNILNKLNIRSQRRKDIRTNDDSFFMCFLNMYSGQV